MKFLSLSAFAVFGLWLASAVVSAPAVPAAAEAYKIDGVHSSLIFRIQHFGVGYFYGRFNSISGTFRFDPANLSTLEAEVEVAADSIDTHNDMRDKHLKGPDFLDAVRYPKIRFKSRGVANPGDKAVELRGDLTLHGVTRPITAKVVFVGKGKDPFGMERAGFEVFFTIKRSDFGMKYMLGPLGDEVKLMIGIEGTRS